MTAVQIYEVRLRQNYNGRVYKKSFHEERFFVVLIFLCVVVDIVPPYGDKNDISILHTLENDSIL